MDGHSWDSRRSVPTSRNDQSALCHLCILPRNRIWYEFRKICLIRESIRLWCGNGRSFRAMNARFPSTCPFARLDPDACEYAPNSGICGCLFELRDCKRIGRRLFRWIDFGASSTLESYHQRLHGRVQEACSGVSQPKGTCSMHRFVLLSRAKLTPFMGIHIGHDANSDPYRSQQLHADHRQSRCHRHTKACAPPSSPMMSAMLRRAHHRVEPERRLH